MKNNTSDDQNFVKNVKTKTTNLFVFSNFSIKEYSNKNNFVVC